MKNIFIDEEYIKKYDRNPRDIKQTWIVFEKMIKFKAKRYKEITQINLKFKNYDLSFSKIILFFYYIL